MSFGRSCPVWIYIRKRFRAHFFCFLFTFCLRTTLLTLLRHAIDESAHGRQVVLFPGRWQSCGLFWSFRRVVTPLLEHVDGGADAPDAAAAAAGACSGAAPCAGFDEPDDGWEGDTADLVIGYDSRAVVRREFVQLDGAFEGHSQDGQGPGNAWHRLGPHNARHQPQFKRVRVLICSGVARVGECHVSLFFHVSNASKRPLYLTHSSPWGDSQSRREPEFRLPSPYYNVTLPTPTQKMQNFAEFTLFYIFYAFPRDALQEAAAQQLCASGRLCFCTNPFATTA